MKGIKEKAEMEKGDSGRGGMGRVLQRKMREKKIHHGGKRRQRVLASIGEGMSKWKENERNSIKMESKGHM